MFSMILDLRTLSVTLLLITFSLSLIMTFIWRTNKTYSGFEFWIMANASAAVGFLFLSFREIVPDFFSIVIANCLISGSLVLSFLGNRKFHEFESRKAFSVIILALYSIILVYFTYFNNQVVYRIILTSFFLAIISGYIAWDFGEVWKKGKKITNRFIGSIYLIFSFLMIMRGIVTLLFSEIKDYYTPDLTHAVSHLIFIVFTIAWTFIYMSLNNARLQQELVATKVEFEKLATTDFLTGINNNRRFFEIGEIEMQRARRFHHPLSVIMFDIDFFKKVNDTFGHAAGDKVLVSIVEICKHNLRDLDVFGRLGGEEFGIILPHTDIEVGQRVAERLRRALEEANIKFSSKTINITASFGITEFYESDQEIKDLLFRADIALYEAKQSGRNEIKTNLLHNPSGLVRFHELSSIHKSPSM